MRTSVTSIVLFVCLSLGLASIPAQSAAIQDIVDLTGFEPSPVPGQVIAPLVPLRWDARCIPVHFKVNDTQDPIPNPLGPAFLSLSDVEAALRSAAERWNQIPTSFMDIQVDGRVHNLGARRFDQINEITFRTFPNVFPPVVAVILSRSFEPIAIARPTRLLADAFFSDGDDIDGDGDPDIAAGIETCTDVDGDGDTEFPAGFYKAGTIFDVDIIFNAGVSTVPNGLEGFRFTVDPDAADTDPRSVDLPGVAVQAFGIAHGMSHTMTDQPSSRDGRDATLFPVVDTSDPVSELSLRTVDVDAVATASLLYPEGSDTVGPAALGDGDVAFDQAFGILSGEVRHGALGQPLAGGSVFAVDATTGRVVATAITGRSRFSVTPDGVNATFLDAAFHILDGSYTLAVPPGEYFIGVESVDGSPAATTSFNLETILGGFLGQNNFDEEFYDGSREATVERRPDARVVVPVHAGETVTGIDISTNVHRKLGDFGSVDGSGPAGATPGSYLAVRIPRQEVGTALASLGPAPILQGVSFFTVPARGSAVPVFASALLTTGSVGDDGTATLDLAHPLAERSPFVGQDTDFANFWFDDGRGLAERVLHPPAEGEPADLFLVLRLPEGPPGSEVALPRIGLDGGSPDNDREISGRSYTSENGGVFTPSADFNFPFELILSESPAP